MRVNNKVNLLIFIDSILKLFSPSHQNHHLFTPEPYHAGLKVRVTIGSPDARDGEGKLHASSSFGHWPFRGLQRRAAGRA